MGWFSCLMIRKKALKIEDTDRAQSAAVTAEVGSGDGAGSSGVARVTDVAARAKSPAKSFTYRELCIATGMFNSVNLIGEGGFGKVFKGRLDTGEVVAIKQLNHQGAQGSQEFIVEVLMLSLLHHPNLMTLKGYCTDGDEKLLVYEYMPKGSLEELLFDLTPEKVPLDWDTRVKIAISTARGLEYLHMSANPPVIYRDLKSANVLLDNDFNAKLSDFGLAKLGPVGDKTHVSTRVMGTYGYCAPEYAMSGKLTMKSDIYSLGVVLLELVSGRKSIDPSRCRAEQNLVNWAKPLLKDRSRMHTLADPALQDQYPLRPFQHLVAIAGMCLQDVPAFRPLITDVIVALEYVIQECEASSSSGTRRSYHQPTPSRGDRSRY